MKYIIFVLNNGIVKTLVKDGVNNEHTTYFDAWLEVVRHEIKIWGGVNTTIQDVLDYNHCIIHYKNENIPESLLNRAADVVITGADDNYSITSWGRNAKQACKELEVGELQINKTRGQVLTFINQIKDVSIDNQSDIPEYILIK